MSKIIAQISTPVQIQWVFKIKMASQISKKCISNDDRFRKIFAQMLRISLVLSQMACCALKVHDLNMFFFSNFRYATILLLKFAIKTSFVFSNFILVQNQWHFKPKILPQMSILPLLPSLRVLCFFFIRIAPSPKQRPHQP